MIVVPRPPSQAAQQVVVAPAGSSPHLQQSGMGVLYIPPRALSFPISGVALWQNTTSNLINIAILGGSFQLKNPYPFVPKK